MESLLKLTTPSPIHHASYYSGKHQTNVHAVPFYKAGLIDNPCKTKIACTIGPASISPEILGELVNNGMSIARVNMAYCDQRVSEQEVVPRDRC